MVKTTWRLLHFSLCSARRGRRTDFFYDCRDYLYAALCGKQHTGFHKPYYRHTAGGSLCASGAVSDPIYSLSGAYPAISGDFLCGHSCDVCDGFIEAHGCFCAGRIVLLSVCLSNVGYTPLEGAINRSVETIIGILVSLGVNNLHLPRKRTEDYLFVTGFDGALYDEKNGISPYASFELNQLLQDGLPFTIATERTPASLMADLKGLDLRLPVIAMDGAVLYDVKDKRYRATSGLPKEWVDRICTLVKEKEYHYFLNVIWQNVLLIYFGEFKNEVERELYLSNRRSPYRNYIYGEMPEDGVVVYILLVLQDADADALEAELKEMDTEQELLFLRDKSETPETYCHLKIYHKNATKKYMLERLMEEIPQKKCVAFGSNRNDFPC